MKQMAKKKSKSKRTVVVVRKRVAKLSKPVINVIAAGEIFPDDQRPRDKFYVRDTENATKEVRMATRSRRSSWGYIRADILQEGFEVPDPAQLDEHVIHRKDMTDDELKQEAIKHFTATTEEQICKGVVFLCEASVPIGPSDSDGDEMCSKSCTFEARSDCCDKPCKQGLVNEDGVETEPDPNAAPEDIVEETGLPRSLTLAVICQGCRKKTAIHESAPICKEHGETTARKTECNVKIGKVQLGGHGGFCGLHPRAPQETVKHVFTPEHVKMKDGMIAVWLGPKVPTEEPEF